MMNTTFTKEQINAAIITVLKTPAKRDCLESHKILQAAGYNLWKNNGHWFVEKAHGRYNRYVGAESTWRYDRKYSERHFGYNVSLESGSSYRQQFVEKLSVIDFVAFLEAPINEYKLEQRRNYNWGKECSKSSLQYDRLKYARRDVKYHQDKVVELQARSNELIQKLQDEIKRCQESIVYHTQKEIEKKQELEEVRKELGLVK